MKKDEALSTLIVEGENLKRIFQHIQSWASDEDDIDNLLNDPERKEKIETKEEIEEEVRKVYGNTDAYDFDMNKVLFEDFHDTGLNFDMPDEEE